MPKVEEFLNNSQIYPPVQKKICVSYAVCIFLHCRILWYIGNIKSDIFSFVVLDLFQLQTTFLIYLMPSKDTPCCAAHEKHISILQYIKHISHMHYGLDKLIIGFRNDYFYTFLSKIESNHVALILGLQINPFTE